MSLFPPILLTSCVYVSDDSVHLKAFDDRVNFTLESIKAWLAVAPNVQIVICDNSGFDFSDAIKENFTNENIECINFFGDRSSVKLYGKGYGEGEIIEYAIKNSKYISIAGAFTKCTAKLLVENCQYFFANWNGRCIFKPVFKNVFSIRRTELDYIDTRFYMTSVEFYRDYLMDAHKKLDSFSGRGIEQIFLDIFSANKLQNIFCSRYPKIYGISGASGFPYRNSFKKQIKENFKYLFLSRYSNFRKMFMSC